MGFLCWLPHGCIRLGGGRTPRVPSYSICTLLFSRPALRPSRACSSVDNRGARVFQGNCSFEADHIGSEICFCLYFYLRLLFGPLSLLPAVYSQQIKFPCGKIFQLVNLQNNKYVASSKSRCGLEEDFGGSSLLKWAGFADVIFFFLKKERTPLPQFIYLFQTSTPHHLMKRAHPQGGFQNKTTM